MGAMDCQNWQFNTLVCVGNEREKCRVVRTFVKERGLIVPAVYEVIAIAGDGGACGSWHPATL